MKDTFPTAAFEVAAYVGSCWFLAWVLDTPRNTEWFAMIIGIYIAIRLAEIANKIADRKLIIQVDNPPGITSRVEVNGKQVTP